LYLRNLSFIEKLKSYLSQEVFVGLKNVRKYRIIKENILFFVTFGIFFEVFQVLFNVFTKS
jgi:hypothetical protein